jgi:two-component system, chemotaxis family, sensor kinase CheA
MDFSALELLDTPVAVLACDGSVRFANAETARWLGVDVVPSPLDRALPAIASPRARKRVLAGQPYSFDETRGAEKLAVEYRVRPIVLDGENLLLLAGLDQSKAQTKQVLLEQFSRTIEASNRQLAREQRRLDAMNRHMRRVLDHVAEGLLTTDLHGNIGPAFSTAIERWIGAPQPDERIGSYLSRFGSEFGGWFQLGFEDLLAGALPREVILDQLPKSVCRDGRYFAFAYITIEGSEEEPEGLLIVISDVTADVARRRVEDQQREVLSVVDRIVRDRAGFVGFVEEAQGLVSSIAGGGLEFGELQRNLHTLKGNCSLFGVQSVAALCHEIESALATEQCLDESLRRALESSFAAFVDRVQSLISERSSDGLVQLYKDEYDRFLRALAATGTHGSLLENVSSWHKEPTRATLARLAEQSQALARRLGKTLEVEVVHNDLRLERVRWARLWSELVHVLRNAVDHGIEPPEQRIQAGKPGNALLRLETTARDGNVIIIVSDDGRGVDWDKIAAKARAHGLPATTHDDLVAALFVKGISARDQVTALSGRGVGMAALQHAVRTLEGRVDVYSRTGSGTTVQLTVPADPPVKGEPERTAVTSSQSCLRSTAPATFPTE